MKLLFACLGLMWLASFALADGIREGMTRAEVEAELGPPVSFLVGGNKTILTYPNAGRVELVNDQVTMLVRVPRFDEHAAAAKAEAARAKQEAAAATEAASTKALTDSDVQWAGDESYDAVRQFEATVEDLIAKSPGGVAEDYGLAESTSYFWQGLAMFVLVQFVVGIVILKLAFAWTDVHADWSQMILPSLAAALSGAVVKAVAFTLWNTPDVFHVDNAVSYGALLFTLSKTTHACTWRRAAGVAAAAKLMSIVVWVFLGVAITNVLFA